MNKRLTVEIELDGLDEFRNADDLERFVIDAGRQIQRRLFRELTEQVAETHALPRCPKCDTEDTIEKGSKNRVLKTSFGDVAIPHPRHRCQRCGHYFFD